MAINLATKYSSQIDEQLKVGSLTDGAVNQNYDFVGAKTVVVYSMGTSPLNDYKTSGTNRYGEPEELEDTKQELTLTQCKAFTFTIDKTHAVDTPEGIRDAAKALKRQLTEVVIPYVDAYRFEVMAKNAKTKIFKAVTAEMAYTIFCNANAELTEMEVPTEGRIAYLSPAFLNLVKSDKNFVKSGDISQEMLIQGQIGMIDGVRIMQPVPSVRFPAGASFLITHPMATTAPTKLNEYKIHQDPPGIAGNLVEGLLYFDAFVLNNKKNCIAVCYGNLGALTVEMEAAGAGKGTVTVKGNIRGDKLVYKTGASVTKPALGGDVSGWTELPADGVITATSGHKIVVAVSVDGKAVAASEADTVTVGA